MNQTLVLRLVPALFVLLWSTGWISARAAAPYADPLTFLTVRFALAALALAILAWAAGARWPRRGADLAHALVMGALLHAVYLGGIWWAIRQGMPAAVSGVIAAVQPILTALLAPVFLGEVITRRQWLGIGLGFAGIGLVLEPKLALLGASQMQIALAPLAANVLAMISMTLATFYQKRFIATGDLRTTTALQYGSAALIMLPVAYALEPMQIAWNGVVVLTMAWSVIALSIGAIALLFVLIRKGAVSRAATLIYLVPPAVAVEAMILFGESLVPLQIVGMLVTVAGVALAVRRA